MSREVNAIGELCPMPVVKAKNALEKLSPGETLTVLVDNQIAVSNLERFARSQGGDFGAVPEEGGTYRVTIVKKEKQTDALPLIACGPQGPTVVAMGSNRMGDGDEALGKILIKGFLFALTQLDEVPDAILFYNSGAFLTTEGSDSVQDIKALEAAGAEIFTCGTCLNHYALQDKLQVGQATNMYSIVEKLTAAGKVIRP